MINNKKFNIDPNKIQKIEIYTEHKNKQLIVGELRIIKDKQDSVEFEYSNQYLFIDSLKALSDDLPLTSGPKICEGKLFQFFEDLIPNISDPKVIEYCQKMNFQIDEKNPLIKILTLGRMKPSNFKFVPKIIPGIAYFDVVSYRESLGLNELEFASFFRLPEKYMIRIEEKEELVRRLILFKTFPILLKYQLSISGFDLTDEKRISLSKLADEF